MTVGRYLEAPYFGRGFVSEGGMRIYVEVDESRVVEAVRRMMTERFSDKLSMEEIANFSYAFVDREMKSILVSAR